MKDGYAESEIRKALDHSVRRQIMRTLNRSDVPRSFKELATTPGLPANPGLISYHVHILQECDCVTLSYEPKTNGGLACLYTSKVVNDQLVLSILEGSSDG